MRGLRSGRGGDVNCLCRGRCHTGIERRRRCPRGRDLGCGCEGEVVIGEEEEG